MWSTPDVALFRHDGSAFLLQNFYVKEHADNFKMHLLVENVDQWWRHAAAATAPFGISVEKPSDKP